MFSKAFPFRVVSLKTSKELCFENFVRKGGNADNQHFFFSPIFSTLFPPIFSTLLNPLPNEPWFSCVCSISLLKTLWEKEKLLVTSNFSFSHSVLHSFRGLSAIFLEFKFVVCKLFQFGRV